MKKLFVTLLFAGILSFIPSSLHHLISSPLSAQIPSDGLVAWYPFNGNANDESGNGNDGMISGAALATNRFNEVNGSFSFYGQNDYIQIETNNGDFDSQNYTLSFWIKTNQSSSSLAGGPNINPGVISRLPQGGPLSNPPATIQPFCIYEIGGILMLNTNNAGDSGTPSVLGNTWNHVIFSKSNGVVKSYFNGVLHGQWQNNGQFVFNNEPIRFGRSRHTYWKDFSGELDDIAFYNRALSETEVQEIFQDQTGQVQQPLTCNITAPTTTLCEGESVTLSVNTTGGAGASSQLPTNLQQGLVAYYPFNGNANDESGNGNNGVVNGATLTSDRFGNVGSAYSFDGVNDFITISSLLSVSIPSSFTVSFWIKTEDLILQQDGHEIIADRDETSFDFKFRLNYGIEQPEFSQGMYFQSCSNNNQSCVQSIVDLPTFSEWEFYTMSYNGQENEFNVFKNGFLIGSSDIVSIDNGNRQINIGRSVNFANPNGNAYYNGLFDDLIFHNRALTPSEIQQLYTAQSYAWSTNETTPTITITPTQNTTYSCTVTQGNQTCTASVDITVTPAITNAVSATIVEGQSYTLGSQTLTTAGTYNEVFTSAAGCDSTVTLTLSVEPLLTCDIIAPTTLLCEGESVTLSVNTTGGAGASSQLPANLQQGLVAYYPFNGNANDESGNGNNGVVNGATLIGDRHGDEFGSYRFNGLSDFITTDYNGIGGNDARTFSVWFRTNQLYTLVPSEGYSNEQMCLLSYGSPSSGSMFDCSLNHNCQGISLDVNAGLFTRSCITSDDFWHNVVFVFHGNTINKGVVFYLDGLLVDEFGYCSGQQGSQVIQTGNAWPLVIGGYANEQMRFFKGQLDDIMIYNRALSPSEIQQLYTAQSYAWSNNATTPTITVSPTENTTYSCTVTHGNQTCTASVDITVNPNVTNTISATIIEGETYTLGAQILITPGTYTEVFTSATGCDSTVTLTLAVEPLLTCEITAPATTLCEGAFVALNVGVMDINKPGFSVPMEFNGHLYYKFNNNLNWHEAKSICDLNGGYLAIPNSIEESIFIRNISEIDLNGFPYTWIGISDESEEGVWKDVNGLNLTFTDWALFEPNNENNEDYGLIYSMTSGEGKWNDGHSNHLLPFVMEVASLPQSVSWSNNQTTPTISVSPNQTTTYTATVTTATQTCSDSITITVNPLLSWYSDADADGFGNPDDVVQDCNQPQGYIADNTDCNDDDATTYPGASEICDNNRDENCDGVDSLCFVPVLGCTDVNACNFNPEANTEDNSCILPQPEICNGLDDNCNGQIDEGLSAAAINAVSAVTALYPVCSGNSIRSANLNNGANSAVIEGSGNDLWFSINAQFNTLRAGLSAATGDNDVRLYTIGNTGCLELIATEHEITTGNQVLLSDQLTVGQTYYVAVHNISGAMNPSAKICFNHLTGSSCDHYYSNNTGIYSSVCNSFKAQYRANAVAYTFDILSATQNNVNQNITPWSYTTTSASTVVARLGTLLPANQGTSPMVYTLKVPVLYSLFDAAGNFENLFAQATTTCTVTLNAEATIALRSSDRCPTNKSLISTIAPDRTVCGAMRYDWEFTEVLPNPGTAQVVQGGAFASVFFLSNVPGITAGKTYSVRVRPVHSSGIAGQWGAVQCLRVGSAGMINHPGNQQSENESESVLSNESRVTSISIYPNPTSTGSFVLNYNGARRGESTFAPDATMELTFTEELVMMDITGKVVFKTNVVLNGNVAEIHFGDLESGLYLVDFGGERTRVQVMK